jgi:hypothetical protein
MTEEHTEKKNEESEEEYEKEEDENGEDESTKLAQFVASAMRSPRAGIFEQLLSQHLVTAVITADPLKRTRTITAACLMVQEKDRENLAIDYDLVKVLDAVSNALLYYTPLRRQLGRCFYDMIIVSWGFDLTEDNFIKYIGSWLKTGPSVYAEFLPSKFVKLRSHYNYYEVLSVSCDPLSEWFYGACRCLTSEGLTILRNQFCAWAMPLVQQYLTELTTIVSPSVYSQMLGLARRGGKKDYVERVNEIAGAKKDNEDASGLG